MAFPSHLASMVCNHVFRGERPVLFAAHTPEVWVLTCGEVHPDSAAEYKVVGIGHEIQKDPSIGQLVDIPIGWEAERKVVGEKWVRAKSPPE